MTNMPEIRRVFLGISLVAILHFLAFMIGSVILGIVINTPVAGMAANIAISVFLALVLLSWFISFH